jgi:signal transduction histidine kinase
VSARPDSLSVRLDHFPGLALELDGRDCVTAANEAARALIPDSAPFPRLLDAASRSKWENLTRAQAVGFTAELHFEDELDGLRTFFISSLDDDRRILIEIPRNPDIVRLHDELTALNSELVNAQREITRQRAELRRTLDERARLSHELQEHSEEVQAQNEELLAVTEELRIQQEESSRLNQRLERQTAELRRVLRSREHFFSSMSHELRTPLTGILGYGHLLLDGIAGDLQPRQRQFIERTQAAAQHLQSLLDDLLDLAKLESGTLELTLEQTIIADVVAEVTATLQPTAQAAQSPLLTDLTAAPDFITTDARALRQILLNLMSNAIKFGGGQPVTLVCTRNEDRAVFEVADRGVGVAPQDAERIFEEFGQAEAGRHQKGTGLGLSISRQLAEKMGGTLVLKQSQTPGAVFVLDLPVAGPAEP